MTLGNNYFVDIDEFMLYNFRKCQEGELIYTRKDVEAGTEELDAEAWLLIRQSDLDEFGISTNYQHILNLSEELALLNCEFVISEERFLLNKIKRLEAELKKLIGRVPEHDQDSALIHLSKWMGQMIKEKEITVKFFRKMLMEYGKDK